MAPFQFGVDFFFVLSGFIIFYVHRDDVGQPANAPAYLIKRFVRLYPLVWIVAGGWIALRSIMGQVPQADQIGTSLALYPSLVEPVPLVVWTLRHEILFYLAFCVAILSRNAGIMLFGLWTTAVVVQMILIAVGTPITGVPAMVLSSFQIDFAFGAVVAMFADRFRVRSWVPLLCGLVMVGACAWASVAFDVSRMATLDYTSSANLYLPLNGLAFATVVFGLLCIEDMVTVPRWAVLLGGASYAIYLVHTPVNSVVQHLALWFGNGLGHAIIFVSGIAAGVILHVFIERKITGRLRARLLST